MLQRAARKAPGAPIMGICRIFESNASSDDFAADEILTMDFSDIMDFCTAPQVRSARSDFALVLSAVRLILAAAGIAYAVDTFGPRARRHDLAG